MTANENNRDFDVPPPPQSNADAAHHFDSEPPKSPKKETKRGSFSSTFVPKQPTASFSPKEASSRNDSGINAATAESSVASGTFTDRSAKESMKSTSASQSFSALLPIDSKFERTRLLTLLAVFVPLTIYAFLPAVKEMVYAWWTQLDYSHGFIVIPLIAVFLWLRMENYPGTRYRLTWLGLLPIFACCGLRYLSAIQYVDVFDMWAMFFWIIGVVWFFYGNRVFLWALPSLSFMAFMIPLPWRFEVLMRNYLQQFAAQFAAILLQLIGEPAIPIKNTIRLSSMELSVDAACSGIRFLISILAFAFIAILLLRRPWWQNIMIVILAVPLALFVNAARIALTGVLLLHFNGFVQSICPASRTPGAMADEIAGFVMAVFAVGTFFAALWYLGKVFKKVEI